MTSSWKRITCILRVLFLTDKVECHDPVQSALTDPCHIDDSPISCPHIYYLLTRWFLKFWLVETPQIKSRIPRVSWSRQCVTCLVTHIRWEIPYPLIWRHTNGYGFQNEAVTVMTCLQIYAVCIFRLPILWLFNLLPIIVNISFMVYKLMLFVFRLRIL